MYQINHQISDVSIRNERKKCRLTEFYQKFSLKATINNNIEKLTTKKSFRKKVPKFERIVCNKKKREIWKCNAQHTF